MTTPRSCVRHLARVVLLVGVLAALLPAGASAASPARARDAGPAAVGDSLWAASNSSIEACVDPTSPASLAGCFGDPTDNHDIGNVTTDGVNVYARRDGGGAWSCPIAGAGSGCVPVSGGPWGSLPTSMRYYAAADGLLWIGQANGQIYRCPSDLPWQDQTDAPAACVLLDDAGGPRVKSLLLANSRLYAGLSNGIVWSCDPYAVDACTDLDDAGSTNVLSLAAGAGYLWAGLQNGIIWRCDPYVVNRCERWDTGGLAIQSLSYDGAGTLYAAVGSKSSLSDPDNGAIWSCPVATRDACAPVVDHVTGMSVAAGAGSVFSSNFNGDGTPLFFGATPFSGADGQWGNTQLLYIPATGPVGLGAVHARVRFPEAAKRLAARCADGVPHLARVRVTGPHGFRWKRTVDICQVRNPRMPELRLGLLDPGSYRVRIRTEKHAAEATVNVLEETTHRITLQLAVLK